ncbi:hypothetical protein IAU60_005938 [Kwoniella sp. DSM 27419]
MVDSAGSVGEASTRSCSGGIPQADLPSIAAVPMPQLDIADTVRPISPVAGCKDDTASDAAAPSRPQRFSAPRSHSAPVLGPWTATPTSELKRAWHISPSSLAVPIVGVDGRTSEGRMDGLGASEASTGSSPGKGKGKGKEVERGLSELYITHERAQVAAAIGKQRLSPGKRLPRGTTQTQDDPPEPSEPPASSSPAPVPPDIARDGDPPRPTPTKRGWGSTLVGGALSAGVLGAALGLTAYRLISNKGTVADHGGDVVTVTASSTPTGDDHSAAQSQSAMDGDAAHVNGDESTERVAPDFVQRVNTTVTPLPRSSPVNLPADLPPPPAYEETEAKADVAKGEWEESTEADSADMLQAAGPRAKQLKKAYRYPRRSGTSTSQRSKSGKPRKVHSDRLGASHRPLPLVSSVPASDIPSDHEPFLLGEGEDDEVDDAMMARLDSMSARLSLLISEGHKALQSETGPARDPHGNPSSLTRDVESVSTASATHDLDEDQPAAADDGWVPNKGRRDSRIPLSVQRLSLSRSARDLAITEAQAPEVQVQGEDPRRAPSKIPVRSKSVVEGLRV